MTTNFSNYANAYCNVIRVIRVIRSLNHKVQCSNLKVQRLKAKGHL